MPTVPSTPLSAELALSPVLSTDRLIGLRTPQNQPDATKRVGPVSLSDAATAIRPLLNLNTNNLPGTVKLVRFQTAAQLAAAPDGGDCLDNLNPATLVLGGLAWVEFHSLGYGTTLRLLYDGGPRTPAGSGLYAFRTGDTVPGDTVPVRWVVATGPEVGVVAYPQRPTGYVFAVGELVRSYVSDISTEQFFAALAATALPAPTVSTGDINWRPVSGSALPAAVAPLYGSTGTATNGAMSQAATTAALFFDFTNEAFTGGGGPFSLAARTSNIVSGNNTAVTYNLPTATPATYLGIRLQAAPIESLPLAMVFAGGTLDNQTTLTMQPGDFRIIAKPTGSTAWNTVWAGRGTPKATATTLGTVKGGGTGNVNINADGSMTAPAFAAITQNQYGTHPAFSTQTALNAYLLGGAATVPTTSTPSFTAS